MERRLIRCDGIRLFHLHYWHNVLSPRASRSKAGELIKYDPRNLSRVYWQDQEGNYWPLPNLNLFALRHPVIESEKRPVEHVGSSEFV